jgi:hypothetical protein
MGKNCGRSFFLWLKMAPLAQGVGQKLFFCQHFGSIQLFFNLFFALVLCYQHANLMEELFFEKIIAGGLFFFLFQKPTMIFSKTFLPLNLRADSTKLM